MTTPRAQTTTPQRGPAVTWERVAIAALGALLAIAGFVVQDVATASDLAEVRLAEEKDHQAQQEQLAKLAETQQTLVRIQEGMGKWLTAIEKDVGENRDEIGRLRDWRDGNKK